jgi:hypothetical protein
MFVKRSYWSEQYDNYYHKCSLYYPYNQVTMVLELLVLSLGVSFNLSFGNFSLCTGIQKMWINGR